MKPQRGKMREMWDVLEEHGPLSKRQAHQKLRKTGYAITPKQSSSAIDNLLYHKMIVVADKTRGNKKKYQIVGHVQRKKPKPVQSPSPVEKTPERAEITPTEGLSQLDSRSLALIATIAAVTAALTTIVLRFL